MKKILELTVLNEYVDWSTSELPAGLYLDNNNNFVSYEGKGAYPNMFFIGNMSLRLLKESGEQSQPVQSVSVDDVVKIITVIRANPDNLKTF